MSFIQDVIKDIKNAKELSEKDKNELIAIAQQAWDVEQE